MRRWLPSWFPRRSSRGAPRNPTCVYPTTGRPCPNKIKKADRAVLAFWVGKTPAGCGIDASPVKFFTIACLGGSPEESNDTCHLGGKLGVVRQLEGRSNATRARSLHTALVDPGGVRIALLVRCVVSADRIGKRSRTTGSITCIVVATCGGAGDTSCNRPSTPSALECACQRW